MISLTEPSSLNGRIEEVERRIEHLQAQVEALQAVRAQLQSELALSRLFPVGSGFVRE